MEENPIKRFRASLKKVSTRDWLLYLAAGIPLGVLIYLVDKYKVDVPFRDQWFFIPVLEKSYTGSLTFYDLWKLHNEHRIFFPRIIMTVLAHVSHWNIACELGMNILLAMLTFGLFIILIRRLRKNEGIQGANWLIPVTSLMVFSLTQWQNWLWGWQISFFLVNFIIVLGATILSSSNLRWSHYISAVVLGFIVSYSFGNGFLYWMTGFIILISMSRKRTNARKIWIFSWPIFSGISIWIYLLNYFHPSHHPPIWISIDSPFEVLIYSLTFLGSPIQRTHAMIFGFIGLLFFVSSSMVLLKFRYVRFTSTTPFIALGVFSITSAILIGIGRVWLGSDQALDSRYITYAYPLWLANFIFLYLMVNKNIFNAIVYKLPLLHGQSLLKIISILLICGLIMLMLVQSVYSIPMFPREFNLRDIARRELFTLDNLEAINIIHPEPGLLEAHIGVLQRFCLSSFRDFHCP